MSADEKLPTAALWTITAKRGASRALGNNLMRPNHTTPRIKWLRRYLRGSRQIHQASTLLPNHGGILGEGSGRTYV